MSGFFDQLERDLVQAARARAGVAPVARARLRRRPWGSLLLATALCVAVGAATAGGALYVLRGSVIPAPAVRDVPAEQLPVPGSSRLAELRVGDPATGPPPWTVRVARSRTGLLCGTVGQLVGGRFGLVGLDGRFRLLPERVVDACGEVRRAAASLVGVRVFDARRRADVRSAVYGVAGPRLRAATVTAGGQRRAVPVAPGGIFLTVVRSYPRTAASRSRCASPTATASAIRSARARSSSPTPPAAPRGAPRSQASACVRAPGPTRARA